MMCFFDQVNHDRLMAAVAVRISDRRVLRRIRGFLTAGVLERERAAFELCGSQISECFVSGGALFSPLFPLYIAFAY